MPRRSPIFSAGFGVRPRGPTPRCRDLRAAGMRRVRADLHIHSCLSPCADLDMSPRAVVERSLEVGLKLIAICDHNSAENVEAAIRAGAAAGLVVLAGMEINCREEVHSLALFDRSEQALELQELVYRRLKGSNRPELFGDQVVVNEHDEVEGFNDRLLIGATQLGLYEVVREVHRLGGLSIASHVDRPSFSVLSQLGFLPPDLAFDALEISPRMKREEIGRILPPPAGFPVVTFSDAHFLKDVGTPATILRVAQPCWEELRLALREEGSRAIEG